MITQSIFVPSDSSLYQLTVIYLCAKKKYDEMSSTIIVRIFRIFEELIKVILKVKTELFIFFSKSSTILSVHQFSPMPSKDSLRGLYRNAKFKKKQST